MKWILISVVYLAFSIYLPQFSLPASSFDFDKLNRDLWTIISDTNSSPENVQKAILRLGEVTEHPQKWREVIENTAYSPIHRQFCIIALLKRHQSSSTLPTLLKNAHWLRDQDIDGLGLVTGSIPIKYRLEVGDVFVISILPHLTSRIVMVYVQIIGKMEVAEFRQWIRTGLVNREHPAVMQCQYFEQPLRNEIGWPWGGGLK